MKTCSQYRGFTLVELMITLGLIAIILAVAVPSVTNIIKDNRLATQLNAVISDIHFARSEAAKRDIRVIMCRSVDPTNATPACSGSDQDWSDGYLIFTGEDGNNTYQAGTDTLLRIGLPAQQGVNIKTSLTWNNNLEINPTGTLNEGSVATMALCDDRDEANGRQITVPLTGIPRMYSNNINDCTP